MRLDLLAAPLAIVRLAADAPVPDWVATAVPLASVTRTASELSIVCPEGRIPTALPCERGWRAFVVLGPLDFALTGVLASLAAPLAEAGVSIFALSTYDTDYVLVRERDLGRARAALVDAGHELPDSR